MNMIEARGYVTDGGLETDLIFHHGVTLPEFAAFVLLENAVGRELVRDYYRGYGDIARRHGVGLRLETATWRAGADWGARVGYDAADLEVVDRDAVRLAREVAAAFADLPDVRVIGMIGPRGDGYRVSAFDGDNGALHAAAYHRPQVEALAAAGADAVAAYTLSDPFEAAGVALAAREVGIPVEIAFTVGTDGRMSGTTVREAIAYVEGVAPPEGYLLNCAHPDHMRPALDGGDWTTRVIGVRPNASRLSHAELDERDTIDEGDPVELADAVRRLLEALPAVRVVGGCCGTDVRHVGAMWDALAPAG